MCVSVSGGKKCLFFGNFGVLCFLETPVLRFTLLPYYRRTESNFLVIKYKWLAAYILIKLLLTNALIIKKPVN